MQHVVVDHHFNAFFGGEQVMVLAWFSYFDGTFWRFCKVYEEWADDESGRGENETLYVAAGIMALEGVIRFRFHWNWSWDRAHQERAAATLRMDHGPEEMRNELAGMERLEFDKSQLQKLQVSLGIHGTWNDDDFWALFTSCWAGLPLTQKPHQFGITHGSYLNHKGAQHLFCSAAGHRDNPGDNCRHKSQWRQIREFKKKGVSWIMEKFLQSMPDTFPRLCENEESEGSAASDADSTSED